MRFVVVLLLASCGGDPPLEDGARLRLRYWVYEDGTRQWDPTTFFDTKLDAECQPRLWSDGLTYCTPVAPVVAYRDAKCGDAVGRVLEGETPHAFVREFAIASVRRPSRIYRPTTHRVEVDEFWLFDGTVCDGPFSDAGAGFLEVDEVEPVRIYESAPVGDSQIRTTTLTSSDGMSAPGRLIDVLADSPCVPSMGEDGELACLPSSVAEDTVFRDAACTQPMAVVRDGGSSPLVVKTGCDYRRRGLEVLNFPSYVNSPTGCVEVELDPYQITYELGDRFPIARLSLERVGESRVRPIQISVGDSVIPTTLAYDAMFGVACETTAEDAGRCLPRILDGSVTHLYTTASCDGPLSEFVVVPSTCEPAEFAQTTTGSFPITKHMIRHVSDRYDGPLYTPVDGACTPMNPGGDAYARSEIVPIEAFAVARRE